MEAALEILKRFWGFDSFRKKQDQIISSVLDGKDTLALLPTGGGKSICYQVPGLMKEGVCLVISPLIALMQDQVDQLNKRNIKAIAINSSLSFREIDIQLDNAVYGNTKFLYVSPERLKTRLFLSRLEKMNINLIAIDESHCISEWGYDFRPSYLEIAKLKQVKPNVPFLALTATATPEVVLDIQEKLEFKTNNVLSDSFERSNISYNVVQSNNKLNRMLEYLGNRKESGIIYCATRKQVKSICKELIEHGISANFYHGGLDTNTRSERQNKWINNEIQVIVCTNAFGMGIDKPDVRFVLHYDIPESIEAYFQEAGRAGRDGNQAETYLFYEPANIEELREKIRLKYPPIDAIKSCYKALGNYFQIAIGAGKDESFEINILEFCDHFSFELISTYNALKFLEISGYISLSENFNTPSKVIFLLDNKGLYQHQVRDEKANKVIQFLLRTQMGIFEQLASINEDKIAKHTKLNKKEVLAVLQRLAQLEAITYIPQKSGTHIQYLTERLDNDHLSIPVDVYHKRKNAANDKLNAMINYLQSEDCNSKFLLEYFGEINAPKCGICINCKSHNSEPYSADIKDIICKYLNSKFNDVGEILIKDLIHDLNDFSKDEIMETLRWMIDHDEILSDPLGKTILKN